jgi:leucyl aminopeptidase
LNFKLSKENFEIFKADSLIAFLYNKKTTLKGELGKAINRAIQDEHFNGEKGEIFHIYPSETTAVAEIILVGLGDKKKSNPENLRRNAGKIIRTLTHFKNIAVMPLDNPKDTIPPILEGFILGSYRFDKLKSNKKENKIKEVTFLTGTITVPESLIERTKIVAEGTCVARDFSNLPGNLLTPEIFANEAVKLGKQNGVTVKVLNETELKRLKMGAMLAVGQGSANRPKFVIWEYKGGKKNDAPIVFVGKGVTFDAGGISIKGSAGMEAMKGDMGGAAAVLSLIPVVGKLKPRLNLVGITPLVENLPSGTAYRPGDVLTASNGKTIEVISTDAEGRLILADALVYAGKYNPKYVVDIATLTGACMVALGIHITGGIMGCDQKLVDKLIASGNKSGERLWQLPLWDDYRPLLDTVSADMKNGGGRWGGAIIAGVFLREFTDGYKWAHIDMAGMDSQEGSHPYQIKGQSGWGVRVLSRFILDQAGLK